jgi:serine-type D-Ala-D-Ala carboxypeptidase (penicillin-binding protein 5/6)
VNGWRVVAAVIGAALAGVPVPVASPAPTQTSVPCPFVAPRTPPPAVPSPPAHPPGRPEFGGAALATPGLALPPGAPPPPVVGAHSWVVADLDTGAVLGACAAHDGHPPASVQKLLLAETMLPKLDPTQVVEVVPDDMNFDKGSSLVGLVAGGHYTVETLWYGLLLKSGNDTANVIARLGGGDQAGGVALMNQEAHRLGADDTHAVSTSGVDRPDQFTSAYDLALIARADFARDDFRRYDSTLTWQIPPQPPQDPRGFQIQNENLLLTRYPGGVGGKTGFTDLARHTYVGIAERGGRRLVVTMLDAEAYPVRSWQQGAALLDWGFGLGTDATAVGHLVTPDEAARLRAAPPVPGPAPSAVPVAQASSGPGTGALGVLIAAASVMLLLIAAVCPGLIHRSGFRRRHR